MTRPHNAGVDLLRVLSMFMVVVLHVLGQGGVLAALTPGTPGWALGWTLECACYCAVDCFGLVSGYVAHSRYFSGRRCVLLWAQVAFYSAGIALLFKLFYPESTSFRSILAACFPVMSQKYWYFTAYFTLIFFAPFLTILLENLSRAQVKQLLAAIVFLFCLLPLAAEFSWWESGWTRSGSGFFKRCFPSCSGPSPAVAEERRCRNFPKEERNLSTSLVILSPFCYH